MAVTSQIGMPKPKTNRHVFRRKRNPKDKIDYVVISEEPISIPDAFLAFTNWAQENIEPPSIFHKEVVIPYEEWKLGRR